METYYKVTYTTERGLEATYTRDTVERAYYLYKSLKSDGEQDIKLEEISNAGVALLRGEGCYRVVEDEKEKVAETNTPAPKQPQTLFEMMFGITKEEYKECLANWNRITGENIEFS